MKRSRPRRIVVATLVGLFSWLAASATGRAEDGPLEAAQAPLPVADADAELNALRARIDRLEATQAALLSERRSWQTRSDRPQSTGRSVATGHDGATMALSGRLHADVWAFPCDSPGVNGFESGDPAVSPQDRLGLRRARLTVEGEVVEDLVYKLDVELVGSDHPEFRDAFFGFSDLPLLRTLQFGNQKRPYGLDHLNSSRFNVFMERPMVVEAFNPSARRYGVQSLGVSDDLTWNWQYGVFNQSLVQDGEAYVSDHWQPQVAGRLATTAWWHEPTDGRGYAHLAIAGTWADTDENAATDNFAGSGINEARFATRPEARSAASWIDTGVIADAEHYTLLAAEGVLNLGPLQLVAEQQNVFVERSQGESLYFHGAYAYASYFFTGEHIPWDRETGQIGRAIPRQNFFAVERRCGVERGWGAWQIACRGSLLEVADQDIRGGDATAVTLALNWYWSPYAKLQSEYTWGHVRANDLNAAPGGPNSGSYQAMGTRFVIDF